MTLLTDITAAHWQPARYADDIVTGRDDVDQAIRIILETPKGADPHRPEFGSDLWRYVDYPIDRAVPHVVREIRDAIARWEPRAVILGTDVSIDESQLTLRIRWRLAAGVESETVLQL